MVAIRNFDTVTEAVNDLQKRGYVDNISLSEDHLKWTDKNLVLNPSVFEIDEFYRFEGDTDPGDEMVVYAISAYDLGIKGVLVNAYCMYSDTVADELISKLKIHR